MHTYKRDEETAKRLVDFYEKRITQVSLRGCSYRVYCWLISNLMISLQETLALVEEKKSADKKEHALLVVFGLRYQEVFAQIVREGF